MNGGITLVRRPPASCTRLEQAAIEYMLDKKVPYDNPSSPFGPVSEEEAHGIAVIVMLGRAW